MTTDASRRSAAAPGTWSRRACTSCRAGAQTAPPAGLGRLRDYLAWLHRSGEPMYGEIVETVVDVDRAEDVALAEALAAGRR